MSDTVGVAVVELRADIADLKKGMTEAVNTIKGFGAKTVAEGSLAADAIEEVARRVIEFTKASIEAYGEHQQAMIRLTNLVGGPAADAFLRYAEEIQKTTAFSHDAVLSLENQLASYGVLPGSIESATHALVEFSAQTGVGLPEAGQLMGQALRGQSRELGKYGLVLSVHATRTENLAKLTEFLNTKFHGTAEALKGSVIGAVESAKNSFELLQEQIGRLAAPTTTGFLKNLSEQMTQVAEAASHFSTLGGALKYVLVDIMQQSFIKIVVAMEPFIRYWNELVSLASIVAPTMGLWKINLDAAAKSVVMSMNGLKEHVAAQNKSTESTKKAAAAALGAKGATEKELQAIKALNDEIENQAQIQEHITEITRLETDKRVATARNAFDANASYSQALKVKIAEDAKSWGTKFAEMTFAIRDQFASAVSDMIVNGGNFRDAMKNIGKSILQTFIEEVVKQMVAHFLAGLATMKAASAAANLGSAGAGVGGAPGAGGAGGLMNAIGGTVVAVGSTKMAIDASIRAGLSKTGSYLGGILQGPLGAFQGGVVGKTITSIGKHLFSGGVLHEPTILMGTKSGRVGLAGEDGPEALMSFKDMGLTPNSGRNRLMGAGGGGGGGGGEVHVHFHGTFIDGNEAKMQELVRRVVVPEIKRYSQTSTRTPFIPTRGART